ncbi:NTP transferase domain-containing protein [Planosporangium thailandense]|uniref:NTP transferase domain-containing protein n=1 Tax=Planosporangium thailandense TaxID=765197 RepID=A0ABX0XWQ7_9ACTN|nr:NTP transferase domain-containing protein [Planosporangium thailandense]NJC69699.1 NTP transferase domain-containing protein [Planosporangium thailandense]
MTEVCAVVLAAGEGRRLRPLTEIRPKALCPVGNVPLLDRGLTRMAALGFSGPTRVAVNACYLGDQVVTHVGDRARLSVEPGEPLGTSGGLGNLRDWIDGRGLLVANADAYLASSAPPGPDVAALLDGWDGETVRLLGVPAGDKPAEFGAYRFAGLSLLPWSMVRGLTPEPADLVRTVWRPAEAAGALTVVEYPGVYLDTGTPADYLRANLHAAGDGNLVAPGAEVGADGLYRAVVGAGAVVRGRVTRGVVWPGGFVGPDEHLADAVRVGRDLTVATSP